MATTSVNPYSQGSDHPPRYSSLSVATLPVYATTPAEYDISNSAASGIREHEYHLMKSQKAKPWATLRLSSTAPKEAKRPRYIEGENVTGSVLLDLPKPQAISSVTLVLRGYMIISSLEEGMQRFLDYSEPIWSPSMGGTGNESSTKLQGQHKWDFSFPFPRTYTVPAPKGSSGRTEDGMTFRLPESLVDREVVGAVIYELVLRIQSGIFRRKHKLGVGIFYVPSIQAPPLSDARRTAYRRNSRLDGPLIYSEDWSEVSKFTLGVQLGDETNLHPRSVTCSVYVANPTTYTRGTVIPCYITFSSSNEDRYLVEALITQNIINLELVQSMSDFRDPMKGMMHGTKRQDNHLSEMRRRDMGTAVWFEAESLVEDSNITGELEGEIHLDHDLYPSCENSLLTVKYSVDVSLQRSQDLAISTTQDVTTSNLGSLTISIATISASGPTPISFTPRKVGRKKDKSQVTELEVLIPMDFLAN